MSKSLSQITKQTELVGPHPDNSHQYGKWLKSIDHELTETKCHRELIEINPVDEELIEWISRKIISHHYSEFRLERLKQKYGELGFAEYAEQNRKLPRADKVKKGNMTEIILTDYIETSLQKELIKVFKLKYNPNVDQAIKGDDTLMVDLVNDGKSDSVRLYLGESKFRETPSKTVVDEITKSLAKEKLPLSYSFLVDELEKEGKPELAEKLDNFILKEIKDKGDLIYVGLLLSNYKTAKVVEDSLSNDNPKFVFISIGVESPTNLVNKVFDKAEELIMEPNEI